MVEAIMTQSPLDGRIGPSGGSSNAGLVLRERRHLGKLILRGDIADARFVQTAADVLGVAPPAKPNSLVEHETVTVVWTAPDEWLVVAPPGAETELETALSDALAGLYHAITDTSDQTTVIRLSGTAARSVMAKGCAIDLHPRVFGTGSAAQSLLAKAHVTFWQVSDEPAYDIVVAASLAAYLWAWLTDAGQEFGLRIEV